MNKLIFIIALFLLGLLVACGGNAPTPTPFSDADVMGTVVAGTLTAFPSATQAPTQTSAPTQASTEEPTKTQAPAATPPTPSPAANLSLDNFPNKDLLGENEHYSIYLVNSTTGDSGKTGEVVVVDKNLNTVTKMNGAFTIFGAAIVSDDGKGQYILLSTGTYTLRNAIMLSLTEQKQAVDKFCMSSGQGLFWNDYFIYANCDRLQNRPWGIGEAPSVAAINLKTGAETMIAKSDLTHQYKANQIEGNNLRYTETYVDNEADWADQNLQKTNGKTYDLTLLGSN